jgi:hypothetical protein
VKVNENGKPGVFDWYGNWVCGEVRFAGADAPIYSWIIHSRVK